MNQQQGAKKVPTDRPKIQISDLERRASHVISGLVLAGIVGLTGMLWSTNTQLTKIAATQDYIRGAQTTSAAVMTDHVSNFAEFQSVTIDRFGAVEKDITELRGRVNRNTELVDDYRKRGN